jgi:hypothetical protein
MKNLLMKKITPYLLPSIADILFAILLVILSSNLGQNLLNDCDTGYHIRAGEYILETRSIPKVDMFSFLDPPPAWTAHEWLSEVVMAQAHNAQGLAGVVVFFAFIIAMTYYLFFQFLRKDSDNILLLAGMVFLVIFSSMIHFLARPHVLSLLFLVIWYHILDIYQYHNKNYLYILPLLMLVWVNLHGGFIVGFVLLGTYFTGNLLYCFSKKSSNKQVHAAKSKSFFIIGFVCLLASFINPFGYHILLFPFDFVTNKYLIGHVGEFLPTSFQDFLLYKYLFLIMIAVLMTSKSRLNLIELFLVLGFTYLSLYSVRYIPLFAIIVVPIIIKRLDPMLQKSNNRLILFLNAKSQSFAEIDKTTRGYLWPVLALGLVVLLAVSGGIKHSFNPEKKPVAAVEFLQQEHIPGNMFNNDEFGDYIIYAAYPEYRVFIDGRSDMYGVDHFKKYYKVIRLEQGWENVLETYDIQWILYNADSLLSRYLMERQDWHLVYADKVAHIYVRAIQEYEYFINKYRDVQPVHESYQ